MFTAEQIITLLRHCSFVLLSSRSFILLSVLPRVETYFQFLLNLSEFRVKLTPLFLLSVYSEIRKKEIAYLISALDYIFISFSFFVLRVRVRSSAAERRRPGTQGETADLDCTDEET